MKEIKPQEGFQMDFLSTPADIAIGGGAAGAGKTFALLMEPLRHINVEGFGGVIFRRTSPQIRSEGGLWDTSKLLFPIVGGNPRESSLEWTFPGKHDKPVKLKFSHLEYEKNVLDWQGSQIAFIAFDELTHFSKSMFFYLLSRNRSTCGIKPYVRATCNPDPDSWVADFIEWWINQDTGYPIPERAGKLRYFLKDGDNIIWGDSKQEVLDRCPHIVETVLKAEPDTDPKTLVKSATFIPGSIYNNKELLKKDPGYLGNLLAQDEAAKAQLLEGNWKIRTDGTDIINFVKMKDAFTNEFVKPGRKCITADVALKGSDLLIIGVWDGFRLIDIDIWPLAKGNDIINALKDLAKKYAIPQSQIVYDDDGAGSFIDGFIETAVAFNNGARPIMGENYFNRKTQMYYKLGELINKGLMYISPEVANRKFNNKTIRELIMNERRAIKRDKKDMDGKLRIIPKDEMKTIIGHSPDIMDMMMMRMFAEYLDMPKDEKPKDKSGYGFF
ncbi:terminase family protein [Carboxylicivirga sediminis]|uniref:Terminase family protein n=1 Tax=Carboxylicivirga sediminis TaxID=2006564 RepID=A0A941F3R5_9BACT|nr:terminase family protein [Carboxylicivirga sediminis]MBR8535418.1 terminase family protein [Carboxylicivirga sediminis]